MGPDKIAIPEYCWKIVFSLTTKKKLFSIICPNDNSDTYLYIEWSDLKKKIGYQVIEMNRF